MDWSEPWSRSLPDFQGLGEVALEALLTLGQIGKVGTVARSGVPSRAGGRGARC